MPARLFSHASDNPFDGWIEYHPWFTITEEETANVQNYLMEKGHSDGPENFQILIDWRFWSHDLTDLGEKIQGSREDAYVALCIDGGDSEAPIFFFLRRRDWVKDNALYIHVPEQEGCAGLMEQASRWKTTMHVPQGVRTLVYNLTNDWPAAWSLIE